METPHTIVYLFSKYSNACNSFTELINQANIDYLSPLCIDNKDIRNRVLTSKFNIQFLPCLLFVYSSGNIEKFEGDSCFRWANELKAKIQPPLPPPVQEIRTAEIIPSDNDTIKKTKSKKKKKEPEPEEESDEESDEEQEEEVQVKKTKTKVSKNKVDLSKVSLPNLTDISELLGDIEDTPPQEDITSSTTDMMRNTAEKGGKKEHKNSGTMALAQEMQKMRENMDAGNKKPPFP